MESNNTISENDSVILRSDTFMKVFEVKRNRTIFVDKAKMNLNAVIGHKFGSSFEYKNGQLVKVARNIPTKSTEVSVSGADNRDLIASTANQQLSDGVIEKMKEEGVSGQNLIEQLIKNSSTFEGKTEFSQEKYVKKKKLKHERIYRVLRPTARLMAQMLYRTPAKICNLRDDSLAEMLHCGNIHAGLTVAVVDTCSGLLVSSVLEKMAGTGKVIQFFPGENSQGPGRTVRDMNFPKEILDSLYAFPLNRLTVIDTPIEVTHPKTTTDNGRVTTENLANIVKDPPNKTDEYLMEIETQDKANNENTTNVADDTKGDNNKADDKNADDGAADDGKAGDSQAGDCQVKSGNADCESKRNDDVVDEVNDNQTRCESEANITKQTESCAMETDDKGNCENIGKNKDVENSSNAGKDRKRTLEDKQIRREAELHRMETTRQLILQRNIDCLLIASQYHPAPIVMALYKYIAPSRPIVVFCQYQQPLEDTFSQLREAKMAVNIKLSEKWYRPYQVLPDRTHPKVNMSSSAGYLLTATTVSPPS